MEKSGCHAAVGLTEHAINIVFKAKRHADHSLSSKTTTCTVLWTAAQKSSGREFTKDHADEFDNQWITGWEAARTARDGGKPYRNHRIAAGATWTKDPFAETDEVKEDPEYGTQLYNEILRDGAIRRRQVVRGPS